MWLAGSWRRQASLRLASRRQLCLYRDAPFQDRPHRGLQEGAATTTSRNTTSDASQGDQLPILDRRSAINHKFGHLDKIRPKWSKYEPKTTKTRPQEIIHRGRQGREKAKASSCLRIQQHGHLRPIQLAKPNPKWTRDQQGNTQLLHDSPSRQGTASTGAP